jgi:outer membrane protein assembly factor BamB
MEAAQFRGVGRRSVLRGGLASVAGLALACVPGTAEAAPARRPSRIALPNGFAPEDIAAGRGGSFYVGSLVSGAVFKGNFRTGSGRTLVRGADGPSVGMFVERRHNRRDRLWVAGGPSGQARVYDSTSGALLATYRLADPSSGAFVSDVVVTEHAAYYTDSFRPQLYVVPLRRGGGLPAASAARTVRVRGDVVYQSGPNTFNLNGIVMVRDRLVTAHTVTGQLFTLNPWSGRTKRLELVDERGRATTVNGADGMVARGRTLVIAQNFPQSIGIVRLAHDLSRGRVVRTVTDGRLDIPSSVEVHDGNLFALNARFTTPRTAQTTYDVVRL